MTEKGRGLLQISEQKIGRFVMSCMAIGFAALILAGAAAAWMVSRTQEHTRWVNHTYEVERRISEFQTLTERMESTRRGYLLAPDARFRESFETAAARIPPIIAEITRLTRDNSNEQQRIREIAALNRRQTSLFRHSIAERRQSYAAAAGFQDDGSVQITRRIRQLAREMVETEAGLLEIRNQEQKRSIQNFFMLLTFAGVLLIVVAALSLAVMRRYTRDLSESRNQLRQLNENLEAAVEERTGDLQRANEEIQRFAYIVSHDLRSPLVNVMGFTSELDSATKPIAELITAADAEVPHLVTEEARMAALEDLPESIGFIRTSTQKMDRLINAILKLSREGRRVITPERLDMNSVIASIRDTLQHRTDEIGATIGIEGNLPVIVSDRVAIEQIFSNIIENAVKYLDPNRPGIITVRGYESLGRVHFAIEDNGRGIDPKDHQRIFDLFRRSGAQTQPGEGIGLAHVRALAYRLGGTITCESELGSGATFHMTLPSVFLGDQGQVDD